MKKVVSILLAVVISAITIAGCTAKEPVQESDSQATSSVEKNSSESTSTVSSDSSVNTEDIASTYLEYANEVEITETHVTFTDDSGREKISIEKNPQKVAVLYGSLACLWYEAGGTVQFGVGGDSAISLYEEQIGKNFLEDEGVVTISDSSSGKSWDVESILATQPDLIVCATAMNGYSTISAPAEAAGIPVIAISYKSVKDYLKWFKVFCNINSKPELWDSVANKTAEQIVDVVSKVPEGEAPRVLSLSVSAKGLKANCKPSQVGTIVYDLGGVNVADSQATEDSTESIEINLETIYAENPDIIFISPFISEEETRSMLESCINGNPVWDSLDAVKNKQVYFLPKNLFHIKPNHLYQEAYKVVANYLYPNVEF